MQDILLAGPGLDPADFLEALRALQPERVLHLAYMPALRAEGVANDCCLNALRALAREKRVDCLVLPAGMTIKNVRLITLDMDSTLIQNECIDDMAELAGCGPEMARRTREAMEGLWPFTKNLTGRVALLAGAPAEIASKAAEHIRFNPGAERLMAFMKAHNVDRWILSGGFTQITEPVAEMLGMTGVVCNELVVKDGKLTGEVVGPAGGKILDADGKRRALEVLARAIRAELPQTIASGDGANDIEMVQAAGAGFAFHAKPKTAEAARWRIDFGGLDVIAACYREFWENAKAL